MNKIKVLQVVWRFNTGGAERMVVNFHNYFSQCTEVDICTLSFTPSKDELWERDFESNGSVRYLPHFWLDKLPSVLKKIGNIFLRRRLRRQWFINQINDYKPNIIHIHLANMASELYDICRSLPKHITVLYHLHSMPEAVPYKYKPNIIKAFKNNVYRAICVTELQRKSAVKYYGISPTSDIVYNGIDESKFTDVFLSNEEKVEIKDSFHIDKDDLVVGCVGRGAPVKNYLLLAKAAACCANKQKTTLLIVGELQNDLRTSIKDNIGNARVIFAGQRQDTNKLYRVMDVFVLASFYESSSIVTVEAQLSGTPCVISSSISDEVIISDGVIKVSPFAHPEEWCSMIEKQKGKMVRVSNPERFDFKNSVDNLLRIYKQSINDKQ